MKDLRRVSVIAIVLIVLLRISIGWQFLYEGMWKYSTLGTANPWSAEGYLKNAQGPFRDHFRSMTGDPDDLGWLDYTQMSRKWHHWRDRFVRHYRLDEEQQNRLNRLLDGSAAMDTAPEELPPFDEIREPLAALPDSVKSQDFPSVVKYDEAAKQLVAVAPLLPSEQAMLKRMVDVKDQTLVKRSDPETAAATVDANFYKAVDSLASKSHKLSYRHRLAAALRGDPDNAGVIGRLNERGSYVIEMGTVTAAEEDAARHNIRYGKIQEYRDLLSEYETALKKAAIDYQSEHAERLGRKLTSLRNELVGPIRKLESELKEEAAGLLTREQLARGSIPPENTPLHRANMQAMWGLLILGPLLIVGLFTRGAALLGAVMMLMFYLVMPPWPGVPQPPGPEHSFIINKNLIECMALLAIAALPSGSWFGIDGIVYRLWSGRQKPSA